MHNKVSLTNLQLNINLLLVDWMPCFTQAGSCRHRQTQHICMCICACFTYADFTWLWNRFFTGFNWIPRFGSFYNKCIEEIYKLYTHSRWFEWFGERNQILKVTSKILWYDNTHQNVQDICATVCNSLLWQCLLCLITDIIVVFLDPIACFLSLFSSLGSNLDLLFPVLVQTSRNNITHAVSFVPR